LYIVNLTYFFLETLWERENLTYFFLETFLERENLTYFFKKKVGKKSGAVRIRPKIFCVPLRRRNAPVG